MAGATVTQTIYLKNPSPFRYCLNLTTTLSPPIECTWDKEQAIIDARAVSAATITLNAIHGSPAGPFSFTLNINAVQAY